MGLILYTAIFYYYYVLAVFKNISTVSDQKLTYVASLGGIFDGCSRIIWATIMDKFGFRNTYLAVLIIQLLSVIFIHSSRNDLVPYSICVLAAYMTNGATFATFPPAGARVFGSTNGGLIFTVIMYFVPASSFTAVFFDKTLGLSEKQIFDTALILTIIAIILHLFFDD